MIKMNEEVYLQNIVFKKTYDDKGCVMGEIVFKNAMTYEEFENILDERYFVLTDKQLQNNWNELKKWLESKGTSTKDDNDALCYFYTYNKMQKLEQGKDE